MKINKRIKMLLAAGLLMFSTFTMSGCTSKSSNEADNKTQTEQKADNEKKTDKEESKDSKEKEDKKEDSAKTNTENKDDKSNKDNVISDKKAGEGKDEITYYTYDIDKDEMISHNKKQKDISVESIVNELVESKVLQEGTKVNKAQVENKDGVKTLVVDMNQNFVDFNQGSSEEMSQIQGFANSLIKSFNVDQVLLTVEGKPYSGGHVALNEGEMLKYK
ncbi:MAG: GerMN domain-containing protein [Peptostreptococcus sp.]|uniref:GerMN domain-containing protein n=1 Tax=Peptostreptococcus sp. TaxID=1262 RepID=UPI002FC884FD